MCSTPLSSGNGPGAKRARKTTENRPSRDLPDSRLHPEVATTDVDFTTLLSARLVCFANDVHPTPVLVRVADRTLKRLAF